MCENPKCKHGQDPSCTNPAHKTFRRYRRKNYGEMRPYIKGEDLAGVSVSDVDDPLTDMGMIARNPENHEDQWYVAREYFEENFEEVQ